MSAPHAKIPATIVTGFLGAGKTSLVRHLIEQGGRRLAILINEFGDLGVDRELLLGCGVAGCREEDIVELANGCICCTVADEFLPTMRAILERDSMVDHIVIETSGLALPKPLVQAFAWPEVRTRVTVDGEAVAAGRFANDPEALARARAADPSLDHESPLEELFEEQIACADMIVLNKLDRVDDAGLARAQALVAPHLRPAVKVVQARHGAVAPQVLLGLEAAAEDDLAGPSHLDAAGQHDHDDFTSFVVPLAEIYHPEDLAGRLRRAAVAHDILRIKGFAAVRGRPLRLAVQAVGDRIQHHFDRPWHPGEARTGALVVIGQAGLDRGAVESVLAG
jgi:cobalamin biosynthesis protein CobW